MAKKMDDATLRQLLDNDIQQSTLWASETVRGEQLRNLSYYLGYPMGNEVKGRSQVVSWDVFEIVESAMPGFIEPFFSGDDIGEFAPRTPEDEPFADQATDYVNYLIKDDNNGFLLFNTWFKDALLSKIGVVRAEWVKVDPERITLRGISTEQLTQILQNEGVELVAHTPKPDSVDAEQRQQAMEQMAGQLQQAQQAATLPGPQQQQAQQAVQALTAQLQQLQAMPPAELHDITYLQAKPGRVQIENVKPENFIVSRGAASLEKARVAGEIVTYTRSDLAEMGFRQAMEVQDFEFNGLSRENLDDLRESGREALLRTMDSVDPTMEEVRMFRGFVRADVNGDGVAEWRYILAGGGEDGILENEEAQAPDYCVLTPIPIPHRVVGMAYADAASGIQDLKTVLTRQYLDGLYAAAHPKTYVNMSAKVKLDDLISTRIGGIVRGEGPANIAVQPLVTTVVSKDALEGMQMADGMRETRLGITRYNQGLDADSLNKTATGIGKIMTAADKRQLMTLRILAETGVKDLFKLVLRLVCEHQDKARTIRLRNEWVEFNPRDWNPDMDAVIAVGIGSGDRNETLQLLQQFGQYMQWAATAGAVLPQNVYEFGLMLAKNAKLKGADTKLLTDPSKQPKQAPQPPVEILKLQATQQIEGAKLQATNQIKQAEMQMQGQLEQMRADMQQRTDVVRQQAESEQHRLKVESEAQLAQLRMQMDDVRHAREMDFERWKAELEAATRIQVAQVSSKNKLNDTATQAATAEITQEVQQ